MSILSFFSLLGALCLGIIVGMAWTINKIPTKEEIGKHILDELIIPPIPLEQVETRVSPNEIVKTSAGEEYRIVSNGEEKYSGHDSDEAYRIWISIHETQGTHQYFRNNKLHAEVNHEMES